MRELVLLEDDWVDLHTCPLHKTWCNEYGLPLPNGMRVLLCPVGPHTFSWREVPDA